MRCVFAEVKFENDKVTIAGNNGEGKSSFAKSIWALFGGKDAVPDKPVTEGAEQSLLHAELDGDFVITRIIYPDRSTKLELKNKDGGKYPSPQSVLDGFNLRFGFWPQRFINDDPKKQAEIMRQLLGLDFTRHNMKIESLREKRTIIGRDLNQLKGQLAGMPEHKDAPTEQISVAALMDELKAAQRESAKLSALDQVVKQQISRQQECQRMIDENLQTIEKIKKVNQELAKQRDEAEEETRKAHEMIVNCVLPDTDGIEQRIAAAEGLNAKRGANLRRAETEAALSKKVDEYEALGSEMAKIAAEKEDALVNAKFPVSGLGFDDQGLTFKAQPFSQASTAQQWEVAVAIGFALNPELKLVYIEQGSLLDEKTLARVEAMVKERGGQLLIEMVGDAHERAVIFEDGVARAAVTDEPKVNGAELHESHAQ